MYRSTSLEQKELMALFGEEKHSYFRDEDCVSVEYDPDSESIEEGKSCRSVRSSLSLEIYGLQREQHVYFSNQEYYRRLEELKRAHLRNMAELERMYISQGREWHGEDDDGGLGLGGSADIGLSVSSSPGRRLQRINSQEELDFHDTSSGSDQSEFNSLGELEFTCTNGTRQDRMFGRDFLLSPEEMTTQKQFRFQPKASHPKSQGRPSRQPGSRIRSNSKVTVPKPFQMMLREEERKRHKVRTRSEIELENTLLRRELEELQECQKKFRASPAPAHIHLPLYEVISRRSSQRSSRSRSSSSSDDSSRDFKRSQAAAASSSPQPFHFLERERRKREAKIAAELGMRDPKGEQRSFRARPMPRSVYGPRHGAGTRSSSLQPQFETICTLEREATEGQSEPNSDLEQEVLTTKSDTCSDSCQRCSSAKPVKKQIQLSIELVKERDPPKNLRSPLHPGGPEPRVCSKSHCISV